MNWRRYHIRDVVSGEGEPPPGAALPVGVRREQRRQVLISCSYPSPLVPFSVGTCDCLLILCRFTRSYSSRRLTSPLAVSLCHLGTYILLFPKMLFCSLGDLVDPSEPSLHLNTTHTHTHTLPTHSTPHATLRGGHRFLAEKIAAEGFIVVIPDREGDRACGWGPLVFCLLVCS